MLGYQIGTSTNSNEVVTVSGMMKCNKSYVGLKIVFNNSNHPVEVKKLNNTIIRITIYITFLFTI